MVLNPIVKGLIVFIVGLFLGSFFNVCIWRFPRQISIVKPFSFCPNCNTPIKWYDNIPLLSYLFLGGRCRNCKSRISFRYPLVEIFSGALFLFSYWKLGISLVFFEYIVLFSFIIVTSFIDIDYRAIPGWLCLLGILIGLSFNLFETLIILKKKDIMEVDLVSLPLSRSFLGVIVGMGFSYFMKSMADLWLWFWLKIRRKESIEGETEALGLGDVDFLGMVGAFLGWDKAILVFFLAPIISLAYGAYLIIGKKSHLLAYLPFLGLATFVVAFWGDDIFRVLFSS